MSQPIAMETHTTCVKAGSGPKFIFDTLFNIFIDTIPTYIFMRGKKCP